MSELGEMKMSEEIIEAIQASLPNGQVIRHVGLFFTVQMDQLGQPIVGSESFMAVTDAMVAFRQMKWSWDLSPQQLQEKEALEREQKPFASQQSKANKFAKKFLAYIPDGDSLSQALDGVLGDQRKYSDDQIIGILTQKYGPLGFKWLPEITFSNDVLMSNFTLKAYQESELAVTIANQFRSRGHQVDSAGYFEFSVDGSSEVLCSVFYDIRRIYDHIRNVQLGNYSQSANSSEVTKCVNCGSTELTVRGGYAVCDYCQSKFSK